MIRKSYKSVSFNSLPLRWRYDLKRLRARTLLDLPCTLIISGYFVTFWSIDLPVEVSNFKLGR